MRRPRDPDLVLHAAAEPRPEADAAPAAGDQELAAALARCAAGDPVGRDELRAWQDGRLRSVLQRMLGDERLTDAVLETALDDIGRSAAMLHALGRSRLEDSVFSLLRRHAYAALRARQTGPEAVEAMPMPPVRPRPAAAGAAPSPVADRPALPLPTEVQKPSPAMIQEPPRPFEAGDDPSMPGLRAGGMVTPMATELRPRRAGAIESRAASWSEDDDDERPTEPRRWVRVVLAWLMAGALGFALAYLGIAYLTRSGEAPLLAPSSKPSMHEAPPLGPPLQAPEPRSIDPELLPPAPPARDAAPAPITKPPPVPPPAPLAAPEPTAEPIVGQRVEPAATPLPAEARIFIHHSAGDGAAATRAQTLAQRLQLSGARTVVIRPVPFAIRGLSVRFFHDGDRVAAARTLTVAESLLGMSDHVPADFTSFTPPPRDGTIEVWLPGG